MLSTAISDWARRESFHNKSLEHFIEMLLTNSRAAHTHTLLSRHLKFLHRIKSVQRSCKNFKVVTTFSCAFKHFNLQRGASENLCISKLFHNQGSGSPRARCRMQRARDMIIQRELCASLLGMSAKEAIRIIGKYLWD